MLESKSERHSLFMQSSTNTFQKRLTLDERRDAVNAIRTLTTICSGLDRNLALEIIVKYGISLTGHQVPQTKKGFLNLVSSKSKR